MLKHLTEVEAGEERKRLEFAGHLAMSGREIVGGRRSRIGRAKSSFMVRKIENWFYDSISRNGVAWVFLFDFRGICLLG